MPKKLRRFVQVFPKVPLVKPPQNGKAKPGARWMSNHEQIPALIQKASGVSDNVVIAPVLCRGKIA